jgi:hypothetical protein
MFRAVRRSSSGAVTVFAASGLHSLNYGRSPQAYVNEAANTVTAPDDERRTARNMLSL